jgi:hypothetical protein
VAIKDFQNFDVNLESRSEIMSAGMPCSLQISVANIVARSSAFLFYFFSGMKSAILVDLLMITRSWSHLSLKGKSVMKSMAIASKLVQAVGGAHRLYALPLCFIDILGMIENILLFFRSFSATGNFA